VPKSQTPVIWLDLEETIINNWDDGFFTGHTQKIKTFIDKIKPSHINIWSFAIWDEEHRSQFVSSSMKKSIEDVLGYEIKEYPSVEDIRLMVYEYEKTRYFSRSEFMQMNGKFWSFIKYGMLRNDEHIILIDDAVQHTTMDIVKRNVKITTLNVAFDIAYKGQCFPRSQF